MGEVSVYVDEGVDLTLERLLYKMDIVTCLQKVNWLWIRYLSTSIRLISLSRVYVFPSVTLNILISIKVHLVFCRPHNSLKYRLTLQVPSKCLSVSLCIYSFPFSLPLIPTPMVNLFLPTLCTVSFFTKMSQKASWQYMQKVPTVLY